MIDCDQVLQQALQLHQQGRLAEAEKLYLQIRQQQPRHCDALHLSGVIALQQGEVAPAVELIGRAIAVNDSRGEYYTNYGIALKEQGQLEAAQQAFEKAIRLSPADANNYSNLGAVLRMQGQPEKAVVQYREALAIRPDSGNTLYNLSLALEKLERIDEALAACRQAVRLQPKNPQGYITQGNLLRQTGDCQAALDSYRRALALDADLEQAWFGMALAYDLLGDHRQMVDAYRQATRINPDFEKPWNNLANDSLRHNRVEEAISLYQKAIDAKADYVQALTNRGMALLMSGNFKQGFIDYEWRLKSSRTPARTFSRPLWDGSGFAGKTLLIHAEQGIGDAIQFIRYIPLVARRGGRIVVECDKLLLRLFEQVGGISELIPRFATPPAFDLQVPLLSLPRVMGTTLETIPAPNPYLLPLRAASPSLPPAPAGQLKVGFVWAGNRDFSNDKNRSVALVNFLELTAVPNIGLYSLQKGADGVDIAPHCDGKRIIDLSGSLHDFADTAAIIAQLDLVISVDTAVAHLAGAMGRPIWTLLPFSPDWRWLLDREDSPWYPSMRLFRQRRIGDWPEVFQRLRQALVENK